MPEVWSANSSGIHRWPPVTEITGIEFLALKGDNSNRVTFVGLVAMKACLHCGRLSDYASYSCWQCGQEVFVPLGMLLPDSPFTAPSVAPPAESLEIESEGNVTLLKCRTPGEAYLIAQQLEAADILVTLPEAKVITAEFQRSGFVSLRVSTKAYEAARDVQLRIDRRLWEADRASHPPSFGTLLGAFALGLVPFFGVLLLPVVRGAFKAKGYQRKDQLFDRWFCVGFALFLGLVVVVILLLDFKPTPPPVLPRWD